MSDKARLTITFEVEGVFPAMYALRRVLSEDKGKWWLRHALADALETVLRWSGADAWPLKVVAGRVGDIRVVEEKEGES